MGCDIHLFVEAQKKDGTWAQRRQPLEPCDSCNGSGRHAQQGGGYADCWKCGGSGKMREPWYMGRNYFLFGVLAGVRHSFATPIRRPRGFPKDASAGVAEEYKKWGGDAHTPSYLTLAEIMAHPWDGDAVDDEGVVDAAAFYHWHVEKKRKGNPGSWARDIGGGGVKHVSNEEMCVALGIDPKAPLEEQVANALAGPDFNKLLGWHTRISWTDVARDRCREFLEVVETKLVKLAPKGDLTKIRLVFWFDN